MTGITLENPLRTEMAIYFHCGPLQKLFADKRQNGMKATLIPMIFNQQQRQWKNKNQMM